MNQDNLPSFHPRTSRTKYGTSSPSSNESNNVLSKFQLEKHLGKRTLVTKENIELILIESSKSSSEYFPVESKTHKNTETFMPKIPSYNPFEPRPELTQQFELYSPTPSNNYQNSENFYSPIRPSDNPFQSGFLAAKTESAQEIETTSVDPFPTFWSPSPRDLPAPSSLFRSCSQITANPNSNSQLSARKINPSRPRLPPWTRRRISSTYNTQQCGRVLPPWSRRSSVASSFIRGLVLS
ncbi:hypothetical protein ACFX2J_025521 [Malus domestica]